MEQWAAWFIEAMNEPDPSWAWIAWLGIPAWLILLTVYQHTSSRLVLKMYRRTLNLILHNFIIYILFQAVLAWLMHIGLPAKLPVLILPLLIIAVCSAWLIVIFWLAYGVTKKRLHPAWPAIVHFAALSTLLLLSSYPHLEASEQGSLTLIQYFINVPGAVCLSTLISLQLYLRSGIWLAAKGQAEIDAAQQSLPRLKLIGPFNRHQLILANLTEPGTYYLHELTTDRYYRYELIDDARSKRSRRAASRRSAEEQRRDGSTANETPTDRSQVIQSREIQVQDAELEIASATELPPRRERHRSWWRRRIL